MSEFICGLFFFIVGMALPIHNKPLVSNSREFQRQSFYGKGEKMILFDRVLRILAGVITSVAGYLTMLFSK